jgi:hypothetical protein
VKGKFLKGQIQEGEAPAKAIGVQQTLRLWADSWQGYLDRPMRKGNAEYKDPIHLAIYDSVSGELVAEDDLMSQEFVLDGLGEVLWNDTDGLVLSADLHSVASVEIATLSDWVLNPFVGTAKVEAGGLVTTGDFSHFSWTVITDGDTCTATLDVGQLSPLMVLQVQPNGLGTPENDLLAELNTPGAAYAWDYVTIPEPVTIGLLALIAPAVARRRRRS